jgi:hypothetical protein
MTFSLPPGLDWTINGIRDKAGTFSTGTRYFDPSQMLFRSEWVEIIEIRRDFLGGLVGVLRQELFSFAKCKRFEVCRAVLMKVAARDVRGNIRKTFPRTPK